MEFRYTLTHSSGTHVLTQDPEGWNDINIKLTRDAETHGIDEVIEAPLRFNCQGAGKQWIVNIIDTYGVDETVILDIDIYCDGWERLYSGTLELMGYTNTDDYFECNIVQAGFFEKFLNRIDTEIDLSSLTGVDGQALTSYTKAPFDFNLHSRILRYGSQWGYTEPTTDSFAFNGTGFTAPFVQGSSGNVLFQFGLDAPQRELQYTTLIPSYHAKNVAFNSSDALVTTALSTENNELIQTISADITWDIEGTFSEDRSGGANYTGGFPNGITFVLAYGQDRDNVTTVPMGTIAPYSDALPYSTNYNFSGSTTINLTRGDAIWIYAVGSGTGYVITVGSPSGSYPTVFNFEHTTFNISLVSDTSTDASTCKAWGIHEAFSRTVESITGESQPFRSEFLGRTNSQPISYASNGCMSFNVLTNGYNIRKFTDRPLFTSFEQLYNSLNAITPVGYGYDNGVIRVEDAGYFYDDSATVFNFENVTLTRSNASEYYTSQINIGFDKWKTEDVGGVDEVNTVHQYATRIQNNKQDLDLNSELVTGSYAIEHTRRRKELPETDWQYDEDNFLIATVRNTSLASAEKDENFSSVTGIIRPDTIYNLRYTPARNFIRWLRIINIGLYQYTSDLITFRSGEGNITAATTQTDTCPGAYNATNVSESGDFFPYGGGFSYEVEPLFLPVFFEFQYPLSYTDYKVLRDNRYNQVTVNGIRAFLFDVEFNMPDVSTIKVILNY